VAKASLDKALAFEYVTSRCDVEVRWHPFFLRPNRLDDPNTQNGIPAGTMGTPAGPYWHHAIDRAAGYGIDMSGGVDRYPNVLFSHRLLHYALEKGVWRVQHDLQGLIFKAFYSENVFLGPENLARLAGEVGFDQSEVLAYLRSDQDREEVKRQGFSWSGIGGVPYFFINGEPLSSGSQEPEVYMRAITTAAQKACPGDQVLVKGLENSPQLNGIYGALDTFESKSGRWKVRFGNGEIKALKADNLTVVSSPGNPVRVQGLEKAVQLNGMCGVLQAFDVSSGRWSVKFDEGEAKALKTDNFVLVK
jgi:predicted DsbA family dithiol-disulfide isomerase